MGNRVWQQQISIENNVGVLRLYHPDGRTAVHLFSVPRIDLVASLNWCPISVGYAYTHLHGKSTRLHWLPFNKKIGEGQALQIDHIDRDRSNSQDGNLRIVSKRLNTHNQSNNSVLGVGIRLHRKVFEVRIQFNRQQIYGPAFATLAKATQCRDIYVKIAIQYDNKERPLPTRAELKAIADELRIVTYVS